MPIRIFIDQGHNPQNPNAGAEGNGLREQDVTFEVGQRLAALIKADPRFAVRLSRPLASTSLGATNAESLQTRVYMANSWPADYFISIHCNANPDPALSGSEAYAYRQYTQGYWLGQHILLSLKREAGTRDNGVRVNPSLYVLRRTAMPAVLVELGYLTNAEDAALLLESPQRFAQGIFEGLMSYFGFATRQG